MNERDDISREIKDSAAASSEEARVRRRHGTYFWAVMVAYMVASPAVAILVSRQVSADNAEETTRRSEQAWCDVIATLDDAYRTTPPTTPVGIKVAAAMAKLRTDYRC